MNIKNLNWKSVWKTILVLVVIAIAAIFVYKQIKPFDPGADTSAFKTAGQLENYYKNLSEVYKNDTYVDERR